MKKIKGEKLITEKTSSPSSDMFEALGFSRVTFKINTVVRILDGKTSLLKHKGWVEMNDGWITKGGTIINIDTGEEFKVLDYDRGQRTVVKGPHSPVYEETTHYYKLDKEVNVGDKFKVKHQHGLR